MQMQTSTVKKNTSTTSPMTIKVPTTAPVWVKKLFDDLDTAVGTDAVVGAEAIEDVKVCGVFPNVDG